MNLERQRRSTEPSYGEDRGLDRGLRVSGVVVFDGSWENAGAKELVFESGR